MYTVCCFSWNDANANKAPVFLVCVKLFLWDRLACNFLFYQQNDYDERETYINKASYFHDTVIVRLELRYRCMYWKTLEIGRKQELLTSKAVNFHNFNFVDAIFDSTHLHENMLALLPTLTRIYIFKKLNLNLSILFFFFWENGNHKFFIDW